MSIIDSGVNSTSGYGDNMCKCPKVMNVQRTTLKAHVAIMESITKGRYKYKIEQAVSDQTVDGLTGYGEHFGFYYKSDGRTIGEL